MHIRIALVLAALSWFGVAAAQNQADIAYLQSGVREIAAGDYNGSLIVFGEQSFPVVNVASGWGATEPLIAAARLGKGRMVVMGNTAGLEQDVLQVADTARMIANILRWAAGEKTAPKVGIYKIPGLAARLKRLGSGLELDARDIALSDLALGDRNQVDVVVILARMAAGKDVASLQEYVRGGGGLVTGAVSFLAEPDVDLATEVPGSLTSPAGVLWGRSEVYPTSAHGFRVEPPAELSHAGKALAAFEASEAGQRILSQKERAQIYTTLFRAIWDLPHDDTLLFPRLDGVLAPFHASAVPSAAIPITRDDMPWRLAITRETQQLRQTPPEMVRPHAAAAEFPGSVPPAAPRITATVRVEASQGRWGWFGTGLYAAPGEAITLHVPQNVVDQGLSLAIGIHTDKLWDLDEWSRMPNIVLQRAIKSTTIRAASAFGGGIYIAAPRGSRAGDFDVAISGAVPAPRYIDGKTTLSEWRSSIRNLPAPWAEIESDKIILTVPSSFVRGLDDPAALMSVWNQISDLISEFATIPKSRPRPERLVPDVQITGGFVLHSGYPIMMHLSKAQTILSREEILKGRIGIDDLHNRGMWGLPHELGHQAQNPLWSFEGAAEPTANLFALYVIEKLCHIPVASNPVASQEFRAAQMAKYNFAKPDFERWKQDQWIGTTTYVQMQQAFGWETFESVFAQYLKLPESQQPKSDDEKRDQWMVRFSRQVHRNLGPFFQAWGIPTSETARASIAELPAWMPDELPVPNRGAKSLQ
jgi:hypothetical protein